MSFDLRWCKIECTHSKGDVRMMRAAFYTVTKAILYVYFLLYHRLSVKGIGDLRAFLAAHDGPVVIAANHLSYLDPPLIGAIFPTRLRFIAWDHLFDSFIMRALITPLGAVPVSHENRSSAAGLLRQVMGFLESGSSVLIFPEGQRSVDGRLQPLEGGVALLSAKTRAPILPVWIDGTFEAFPPSKSFPRPAKITVTFCAPIAPDASVPDKDQRRAIMSELERVFRDMSERGSSDV